MNSQEYFHDAMATNFSLKISGIDSSITEHFAGLCFQRLDELEMKLSRFVPDSDISRINRLKAGDEMMLEEEVYNCLKLAIEISSMTNGHFDAGTAELSDIYRGYQSGILNEFEYNNAIISAMNEKVEGSLYLNPEIAMIHCIADGMKIDLGGIGKGYALDLLKELCLENEIKNFTINAGGSTVLVHNETFVKFQLNAKNEQIEIQVENASVSSSGTGQQGNHIFNPATGENEERLYDRVWVCSTTAGYSDAFATAFFSMQEHEILESLQNINNINWVAVSSNGEIKFVYKKEEELI